MDPPLAPTPDDLARAYRSPLTARHGHLQAEAVLIDGAGIAVLASAHSADDSAHPPGDVEHTLLIRLTDGGELRSARYYAPNLGTGRAIAALPDGGLAIAGDVRRDDLAYRACHIRLDPDGEAIGRGVYGPPGITGFTAVTVLDGRDVLAGGTADRRGWLLCSTGRTPWELSIPDAEGVAALAVPTGGGFVTVECAETSTTELGTARLTAFASDRRVRWRKRLPAAGRGELTALTALPDGGLAAVGHRSPGERAANAFWGGAAGRGRRGQVGTPARLNRRGAARPGHRGPA